MLFRTGSGQSVPAVTAGQMREVDRIAMEGFGLGILQMMENAGRNLALNVMDMLGSETGQVAILAGAGGNGGGGLCCARHLHNRGFGVSLVLDRDPSMLGGAAATQLEILSAAGLRLVAARDTVAAIREAQIVVDALIGYSLHGAPRGRVAELVADCNHNASRVLSLDVPSGLDATTGKAPGMVVQPERTLTLALPKIGLQGVAGDLYVADIGIPPEVYRQLGLLFAPFFGQEYYLPLFQSVSEVEGEHYADAGN